MAVDVRKGQGEVKLTREEFERRLRERFYDPEFQSVDRQIADVIDVAWKVYDEYRKSPVFEGRQDIEVAAEDDVAYQDVINAMDTAIGAQFRDIGFIDPQSLSVRFKE